MPFLKNYKCKKINRNTIIAKKGQINGFHLYVKDFPDGVYTGEWNNNKRNGYGKLIQKNCLIYDGQWTDDKRHGYGTIRKELFDGRFIKLYVGNWTANKRNGEGKYFYKTGDIYFGEWKNDLRYGLGIMWYTDNSIYMGSWKNNLYHGPGVLFQVNKNRYEGIFNNGKKHGEGLFYHLQTGQIQKGQWLNDICKTSILQDEFRNHVKCPTKYPICKIELSHPENIVKDSFRQFMFSNSNTFPYHNIKKYVNNF